MKQKPSILFSHQNFPAQFGGFGQYLARSGWEVTFATSKVSRPVPSGCRLIQMTPHRTPSEGVHRFAFDLEKAVINGQAFANAAIRAREECNLMPDIVFAHSGWGSGTFCKAVWPNCKYVAYVEWYYRWPAADILMNNSLANEEDRRAHALARNAPIMLDLAEADLVFCPTEFQARQFPEQFRSNMIVLHDGVDTETLRPNASLKVDIENGPLPKDAEILTYATRGMEPHRGFPEFMCAVRELQNQRPKLHTIIGGEDRVVYGQKLPSGESWKKRMLSELDLDLSRIHFVGYLPHAEYVKLLQATDVHIFLTVPFVLSWSLVEAMSIGCPIVASKNDPVSEALVDGESALLVSGGNVPDIVSAVTQLLENRDLGRTLGKAAREKAMRTYSNNWIWPARQEVLRQLIGR